MPAIAVNGAAFPQRVTGVQRYARELTARLLTDSDVRLVLPHDVPDFVPPPGARVDVVPGPAWACQFGAWGWVNGALPRALGESEVLWSPTIRASLTARRQVITVHDLSVVDHPEWFHRKVVAQWRVLLPLLQRRASHVITDSEFSRARLIDRLGLAADQVSVVPCGVDPRFARVGPDDVAEVRARLALPHRFVLALGSVDPRKNIGLLVEAWRCFGDRDGIGLVLAGGTARTFADDPVFASMPDTVRRLGYVDDADLPALYAAATVFAFPSLYEGFGMPPLEAMAAGTPVVAFAGTAAVVEAVGDAGVLVAGDEATDLAEALVNLVADPKQQADLAARGRARVGTYTWERAAEALGVVLAAVDDER